ncbi:MAG: hypothetical protein VZR00_07330 [Lachnospiraceae bacterium]|nr:hypothetical protein [Lachnospiraceae bacterium]MEE3461679.1 hypothetical protein [Lachnospiraceae bacterium]
MKNLPHPAGTLTLKRESFFAANAVEITKIFGDVLGIAPDHIYVAYQPISSWGWNGSNF